MNEQEINRIEAEAAAEEMPQGEQVTGAVSVIPVNDSLIDEFGEFLDLAANVAGVATRLPVNQRFTPEANRAIAKQAVKVCERQGWDARALLIGQDSALGVWLGLGVAVALPGLGVWSDWKAAKAKEIEAANDEGGKIGAETSGNGQQPRE